MQRVCRVCIPHSGHDYYDYSFEDITPTIGARVWVPFRNQVKLGIVIGLTSESIHKNKLKPIQTIIDETPLLDAPLLKLCFWVASYYQSSLSEVLPLAFPKKYRLGLPQTLKTTAHYQLAVTPETAKTEIGLKAKKLLALIDYLSQNPNASKSMVLQSGFSSAHLKKLSSLNLINTTELIDLPHTENSSLEAPLPLNQEQAMAVETISASLHQFHCFLLEGVTGSGKTEVYLHLVAKVLSANRQVLIIVPEIGLTPQLLSRFTKRFKEPIAVLHSQLNETERQVAWGLAKEGKVRLVIGTRTAIFTPMPELGLIVIDEEHDASLKQMDGVRYSARDTALMRAQSANIPVILGTATPSLETLYNALQNKYTKLSLTNKALASHPLYFQVIDIRNQVLQEGLAPKTIQTIATHLEQDNQVLVFINRRGFAPVLLCHQCGWMADCNACDSHLTIHKDFGVLICHHCGLTEHLHSRCKPCKSTELIKVGAGTQRIQKALVEAFPETAILRIDRDLVTTKHGLEENLNLIHQGDAKLIVGTQLLAKGHHFPRLTLVVILDADNGFYNQDFRALEHLGQLITQVSGRAGRAQYAGEVLIQTHLPQHPLLNTLIIQGYPAFAQELLSAREKAELPPYQFLALIRAEGKTQKMVLQFLHKLKTKLQDNTLTVMGPAPAPLARKAHQHRLQLLVKSSSRKKLQTTLTQLRSWVTINKINQGVQWNIDVDPMDLS
jgi:primosomal protein N' (replication factor Y)